MAGRSAGMSSGSAIAAVSTVGYFGFLLVPPLVGSVAEIAGLRWSFGLIALFGIAITVLVQRILTGEETAVTSSRETSAAVSEI